MKKNLRLLVGMAVGMSLLALSSCAYDPYYSTSTTTYRSGYGQGYGYGGSSFSTSLLISTGDPRWGYDPHCYSYYDYRRRAYYDPYLYGYYPVGYRPPIVYGVPHPHGWRPGSSYIRPPSRISNITVVNYQNRESAYRRTSYDWAKQVRQGAVSPSRQEYQRPSQSGFREESSRPSMRPVEQQRPYIRPDRQENTRPQTRPNRTVNLRETSEPRMREERGTREASPAWERGRPESARPQRNEPSRAPREGVQENRGNGRTERNAEGEVERESFRSRRF